MLPCDDAVITLTQGRRGAILRTCYGASLDRALLFCSVLGCK